MIDLAMQRYCTSRYLCVPGHGSSVNKLLDTLIVQLCFDLHLKKNPKSNKIKIKFKLKLINKNNK